MTRYILNSGGAHRNPERLSGSMDGDFDVMNLPVTLNA